MVMMDNGGRARVGVIILHGMDGTLGRGTGVGRLNLNGKISMATKEGGTVKSFSAGSC